MPRRQTYTVGDEPGNWLLPHQAERMEREDALRREYLNKRCGIREVGTTYATRAPHPRDTARRGSGGPPSQILSAKSKVQFTKSEALEAKNLESQEIEAECRDALQRSAELPRGAHTGLAGRARPGQRAVPDKNPETPSPANPRFIVKTEKRCFGCRSNFWAEAGQYICAGCENIVARAHRVLER